MNTISSDIASNGLRSIRNLTHSFFYSCQELGSCFNSTETRRACFLFRLENTATRKEKHLVNFEYQNVNSLCQRHHYVNSSCSSVSPSSNRNTIFNQSARVFSQSCFLNTCLLSKHPGPMKFQYDVLFSVSSCYLVTISHTQIIPLHCSIQLVSGKVLK